jgi:rubredoxin
MPIKKLDLQLLNVCPLERDGYVLLEDSDCSPAVEFLIVGRDWDSPQCSSAKDGFYT